MVKSTEGRENSRRKSSSKRRLYVPLGVAHSCFKKSKQNQNVGQKCKRFFLQPGKYSRNIPRQRNTFKIKITRSVCEKLVQVEKSVTICCLFLPGACLPSPVIQPWFPTFSVKCTNDARIIIENDTKNKTKIVRHDLSSFCNLTS